MKRFDNIQLLVNQEDFSKDLLGKKEDIDFDIQYLKSIESTNVGEELKDNFIDLIKELTILDSFDIETVDKLLFIDTETTHLNGFIVSLAMIEYSLKENKIIKSYYKEFNPLIKIEEESFKIHKISNEQIANAETFDMNKEEILSYIENSNLIIAFNAIYDIGSLIREFERSNLIIKSFKYLDLMKRIKHIIKAKNSIGSLKDPSLKEAATFFNIENDESQLHNALYDTEILLKVFQSCVNYSLN